MRSLSRGWTRTSPPGGATLQAVSTARRRLEERKTGCLPSSMPKAEPAASRASATFLAAASACWLPSGVRAGPSWASKGAMPFFLLTFTLC